IKGLADEDQTMLKTIRWFIKWPIFIHDLVPTAELAEFLFHCRAQLHGRLSAGSQVAVALKIDSSDQIFRADLERFLEKPSCFGQVTGALHLHAPVIEWPRH